MKVNSTTSGRTARTTSASTATTTTAEHPEIREWLRPFADTDEARRLARLAADAELVHRAMWAGFSGRDWEKIADRLVAYGLRVMSAWIGSGLIYDRCAARGLGIARAARFTSDVAEDLARETVARAFVKFRDDVLPRGIWRPEKGASLTTFFIGQCLLRYPNVHRSHIARAGSDQRHRQALGRTGEAEELDAVDHRPVGTATKAISNISVVEQLQAFDPTTRAIVAYRSENYSWAEVAELVGLSETAAKARLFRAQRQQQQQPTGTP